MTVLEAIESKSPLIANIALVQPAAAKKILSFLIADVTEFLNVGKTMNAAQIIQTAELIISDHETKNLKPDDFKICFNKAKTGFYGKNYDRVDGQVIFEWLRAYVAERMDLREQMSIKEHSQRLKDEETSEIVNSEGQQKVIEILKDAIKVAEEVKKEKPLREKSPRDLYIHKCFQDFEDLYSKKPVESKVGRFVICEVTRLINKKPETFEATVDQVEYVEEMVRRFDAGELEL